MQDAQLKNLLKKMNLPSYRKSEFNLNNLEWLQKNMGVRNNDHQNFPSAITEVQRRIDEKDYLS